MTLVDVNLGSECGFDLADMIATSPAQVGVGAWATRVPHTW
ncbi:MAG: hypothetical protein JWR34_865 [Mycobacterium sp.]|nr:hypothetical protein [Mycobacterium sp.]